MIGFHFASEERTRLAVRGLTLAGAVLASAVGAARAEICEGVPSAAKLSIIVDDVRSGRGLVTASLYPNDRTQYLVKNGALKVWWTAAVAPTTHLCIWLRAPGAYAVAIYQDLNSNHRLDMGAFGPQEPYGISNNPRILFSKPPLSAARFTAGPGTTTLRIHLNSPF